MGVYDEDIAGALQAIKESGALCHFTLPPTKEAAVKPWEDADEDVDDDTTQPVTVDGYVAFFPAGRIGSEGVIRAVETGREIPGGFQQGLIGGSPVLTIKHVCERDSDGSLWAVMNIDPLNVNGELILQTVLFQKK